MVIAINSPWGFSSAVSPTPLLIVLALFSSLFVIQFMLPPTTNKFARFPFSVSHFSYAYQVHPCFKLYHVFWIKFKCISRSSGGSNYRSISEKPSIQKMRFAEVSPVLYLGPRSSLKAAEESGITDSTDSETASNDQFPSSGAQPVAIIGEKTSPEAQEPTPKRSLLTARERLRAARVLSRYTESKPSKPELGRKVLDALRESDGGKRRSGLPEAPTNMLDDSKRGMPKEGWTFSFPGGNDLLLIIFSFVFISTVMFTTTYVVWKLGAIHFNEY